MFTGVSLVQILSGSASLVGLSCEKSYVWLTVCPSSDEKPTQFTSKQILVASFLLVSWDRQVLFLHPGTSFDNWTPLRRTASFSNSWCAFMLLDYFIWPSFAHKKELHFDICSEYTFCGKRKVVVLFLLSRSFTVHICVYGKIVPRF